MIIKIFKIPTMEMWILKNKSCLIDFIEMETNMLLPKTLTINQLINYLPVEIYHHIK